MSDKCDSLTHNDFETEFLMDLIPLLAKEPLIFHQAPWTEERIEHDFSDKEPQLVILLSDESHKPVNYKNCLVFRHYIHPKNPAENERAIPLPAADRFNPPNIPFLERDFLVSFSGFVGSEHRKKAIDEMIKIRNTNKRIYLNLSDGFGKGLSREDYSAIMSQTMLAICPFGGSYETFRLSEALKAGCIPIQIRRDLQWYDPKKETLWINNWEELTDLVKYIHTEKPLALKERSDLCKKFYDDHLTPKAVAQYINKEWALYLEKRYR